mmetsp:Transcript_21771/g.62429  ORF Transcript_21771/g.62429 Transcript_21771/m.62429 type:complete len:317 (+) Transcript_21771:2445-3395(+)
MSILIGRPGPPDTAATTAAATAAIGRVVQPPPLQNIPNHFQRPPASLLGGTPNSVQFLLGRRGLLLRSINHVGTVPQLEGKGIADFPNCVQFILESTMSLGQECLGPFLGIVGIGRLEVEGTEVRIGDGISRQFHNAFTSVGSVDVAITFQIDDTNGLEVGPRRGRRSSGIGQGGNLGHFSLRGGGGIIPLVGISCFAIPIPTAAETAQTVSDGGIEHLLILHDGRSGRVGRRGRCAGKESGYAAPAATVVMIAISEIRRRLKVIQERVGNDAAPASLPHVLLVALHEPSALARKHGHHLRRPRRRRLDCHRGIEI